MQREKIIIVQGGQGAGKTIAILMLLINNCIKKPNIEISVLSEELTKMRRTVISDFVKILQNLNFYNDRIWNKTGLIYTFPNGSKIDFIGLDKDDVGKGLRRDICFFNEANKITLEKYTQVASRSKINILDFNPDNKFWGHDLIKQKNHLTLTYLDNEFLAQSEIKSILDYKQKGFINPNLPNYDTESNIKSKYWANKWRVYGLGQIGLIDGVIFNNWDLISEIPNDAELLGRGLDFGYTNDPTAIVDVYKWNGKKILDECLYASNFTNQNIISFFENNNLDKRLLIVADSSEPKSIQELKNGKLNVVGAVKGADSINYGIGIMQNEDFLITKRSINLINEFESYCWKKDKNENTLNVPIDAQNHGIDSIRYFLTNQKPKQRAGGGTW